MTKERLIEILRKLFQTETNLEFLLKLDEDELQTLVACVRGRLDQEK